MEYGSDFHLCDLPTGKSIIDYYPVSNLYADGRQALIDLVQNNSWSALWVPTYYCYEFIESIKPYIDLKFYACTPDDNRYNFFNNVLFEENEAIIIVNYYGASLLSCESERKVVIIEDHTHDLIGDLAVNSNADWCFASLRKTLPIPDGGILWSPKRHNLPRQPQLTHEVESFASDRYRAMSLKRDYLRGDKILKSEFREIYIRTEEVVGALQMSAISTKSKEIIASLDIEEWYQKKLNNWLYLVANIVPTNFMTIQNLRIEKGFPFSFVLKFNTIDIRDRFKNELIQRDIYPAILWDIPNRDLIKERQYCDKMLSLHCDGRYDLNDMKIMIERINNIIKCFKL